jgi:MEMO1 family protein
MNNQAPLSIKRLKSRFLLLELIILFGLLGLLGFKQFFSSSSEMPSSFLSADRPVYPVSLFNQNSFDRFIVENSARLGFGGPIKGGIIPHDPLAGSLMADFFNRLSSHCPSTLIIVGPNHYERGNFKVLTSFYNWQMPGDELMKPNKQIINSLINNDLAALDDEAVAKDHAITGPLPFAGYYCPNSLVVPLILSGSMNKEDVARLAHHLYLTLEANPEAVLIASVDFSHYLDSQEAREKDKESLEIMQTFDYQRLFLLGNDHLDSPPAIATLLMAMESLKTINSQVWHNTDSGQMKNNNFTETTSYFVISYSR